MKNAIYFFIAFALSTSTLITSCTWGKKVSTGTSKKSGSTKPAPVPSTKTAILVPKNEPVPAAKETTAVAVPVTKTPVVDNVYRETKTVETYTPLPSNEVEKAFKSSFPTAKSIIWTKESPLPNSYNVASNGYKANFTVLENKNTAIYSEAGQLLEAREQILPEQLPPAIYNAIQSKYPGFVVISATSVKYSVLKATYAALIRVNPQSEVTEVVLSENGTFLK